MRWSAGRNRDRPVIPISSKDQRPAPLPLRGPTFTESLALLADSGDYGMLAVLHRKLGWLDELFHRSVAKRMALNTTVPLLVLHE